MIIAIMNTDLRDRRDKSSLGYSTILGRMTEPQDRRRTRKKEYAFVAKALAWERRYLEASPCSHYYFYLLSNNCIM